MTILTEQYEFKNVDWTIAAGGDARDGTTSVQLTNVSGDVKFAFLYWGELNFSGSSDNNITVNGMSVSGERLGTSVDTCWGSDHSIGYFADVSNLVSGNGTFDIAGMGQGGQGASLVVFYDDGDVTNNRDVTLFSGNDSTNTSGAVTNINLGTVDNSSGDVNITLSVGDGQPFTDGALTVNGTTVGTNLFPGGQGYGGSAGDLWDVVNLDISSVLGSGETQVSLSHTSEQDCLQFVNVIVDRPATPEILFLDFDTPLPINFFVTTTTNPRLPGGEVVATGPGPESLGLFTPTQRQMIVDEVQEIFDRSGIAIQVTQTRPASGDYHSVRYSSDKLWIDRDGDGVDDGRLLGRAYEGIDQYNQDDNDIVAVFMDGADPAINVARTTAHEAAHAFGGRHINPLQGNGEEVLDYHPDPDEVFYDRPALITEPPRDGELPDLFPPSSHNPTFHIRHHVLGESIAQLRLEGLIPGTWDLGTRELIRHRLGLDLEAGVSISSLSIALPDLSDSVEGEPSGLGTLRLLGEDLTDGDAVEFTLPEGTAFMIVGSSSETGELDIVMEFDPNSDTPYRAVAVDGPAVAGNLIAGTSEATLASIGTTMLTVEEVIEISGDQDLPELTVTIDEVAISENGGSATVTVSRGDATEGDLDVLLASSDTSEALVPNNLVIPDGETQISVTLTALNDNLVDGTQEVVVSAFADGYAPSNAVIDVLDDEQPSLLISIADGEISENGGSTLITVTRTGSLFAELTATLAVSDASEASVAASVIFPAGEATATVLLSGIDDLIADGPQDVEVTATAAGYASATRSVIVTDDEVPELDVSIADASVTEGGASTVVTITRNTGTEGELDILLSNGDSTEVDLPSFVTIADGETSVDVVLAPVDDDEIDGTHTVTIGASAVGFLSGSASIDVLDDDEEAGPVFNEVTGTDASDYLRGTDGNNIIRGLAGSYDKLLGREGTDYFVFGDETSNGARERDVILDYEVGIDAIVLEGMAEIASIRETSSSVVLFFEGDRDAVYIRGEGVTADNLTILNEDVFDIA